MLPALTRAIIAFAATNIDDIFVLTFFFAQRNLKSWHIVLGQYLGIAALISISLIGFFARLVIPLTWISWLGLAPTDRYGHLLVPFVLIALGIYILFM